MWDRNTFWFRVECIIVWISCFRATLITWRNLLSGKCNKWDHGCLPSNNAFPQICSFSVLYVLLEYNCSSVLILLNDCLINTQTVLPFMSNETIKSEVSSTAALILCLQSKTCCPWSSSLSPNLNTRCPSKLLHLCHLVDEAHHRQGRGGSQHQPCRVL